MEAEYSNVLQEETKLDIRVFWIDGTDENNCIEDHMGRELHKCGYQGTCCVEKSTKEGHVKFVPCFVEADLG